MWTRKKTQDVPKGDSFWSLLQKLNEVQDTFLDCKCLVVVSTVRRPSPDLSQELCSQVIEQGKVYWESLG